MEVFRCFDSEDDLSYQSSESLESERDGYAIGNGLLGRAIRCKVAFFYQICLADDKWPFIPITKIQSTKMEHNTCFRSALKKLPIYRSHYPISFFVSIRFSTVMKYLLFLLESLRTHLKRTYRVPTIRTFTLITRKYVFVICISTLMVI